MSLEFVLVTRLFFSCSRPEQFWKQNTYHGNLQIVNLPLVQDTKGSPLNPEGQVQTGLSDPDLSLPGWQVAPEPQGLGVHKSFRVNSRQDTNGSPVNPGINEKVSVS